MREAQIISAVLARVSIPVLHSAAAIKTLCDIAAEQASQQSECVSATNYMLKVLLEKKYALRKFRCKDSFQLLSFWGLTWLAAWQCVDSLVFHFLRYAATASPGDSAPKSLPVIFHQCMLVFAQRYRNDSECHSSSPHLRCSVLTHCLQLLKTSERLCWTCS